MLRRRTVQQDLPLHTGQAVCRDQDWKKKQRSLTKLGAVTNAFVLSFLILAGMLFLFTRNSNERRLLYGQDSDENCVMWAQRGDCNARRVEMLSACPQACFAVAGVSIDSLDSSAIYEDATRGFAHFLHDGNEEEKCLDYQDDCARRAEEGECMEDETMLQICRKSCLACFGSKQTTITIDFGVEQETRHDDPKIQAGIQGVITKTREYMVNQVFLDTEYESVRRDCRNLDPHCSIYAAMGECHGTNDALAMFQNCAPACHACNAVEHYRHCMRRPEQVDVFEPGGLNAMFERIVETVSNVTVLSRPTDEELSDDEVPLPWILVFDDFLSQEECDWFIAKGESLGFKQTSEITDEIEEDGTWGDKVGEGRTSLDAWCGEVGCEDQPTATRVLNRMLNLTGIPRENTEYMEILKYETGGHYEKHHDVIATQGAERCGNRILTLYTFLSDVEQGGELRFNEIDQEVQPKKGRAVLWQNVLDDNFDEMQTLTFHEAMPVRSKRKYGMNFWFHLRNMREALELGCC